MDMAVAILRETRHAPLDHCTAVRASKSRHKEECCLETDLLSPGEYVARCCFWSSGPQHVLFIFFFLLPRRQIYCYSLLPWVAAGRRHRGEKVQCAILYQQAGEVLGS